VLVFFPLHEFMSNLLIYYINIDVSALQHGTKKLKRIVGRRFKYNIVSFAPSNYRVTYVQINKVML